MKAAAWVTAVVAIFLGVAVRWLFSTSTTVELSTGWEIVIASATAAIFFLVCITIAKAIDQLLGD